MSRWGSAFRIAVAYVVGAYTGNWALLASTMEGERQRRKRDKANQRARQQFNDALNDRLELIDLQSDAARTLCLGRVRYVEGIRDRWSSGANGELLTMFVSVASHEIDAFEQWYLDDVAVTLDGNGWVQTAPWLVTDRRTESVSRTGDGTVTLPVGYVSGSALVTWSVGSGDGTTQGSGSISVSGTGPYTGTVSGTTSGSDVTVSYQRDVGTSHVRIREYLGTDTQSVSGDVAAEYPGKIDATDHFRGIAGALIDFKYNPNVFPQSYPTPTAVFRGAKCYDWRKDSTVAGGSGAHRKATPSTWEWSENPAVCAGRYFSWRAGWNCSLDWARATDMQAAADVCDTSTGFDVAGSTVTLPLYRCGLTISAAADHAEAMDSIMETMAGRHVWSGNTWRMRAGAMATPVLTIDESWFGHVGAPGGEPDDEPVIRAAQSLPKDARTNRVIGKCVDPDQRYQMLPFPAVEDSVLVAAKGERQDDIDLPGVNHIAHAQNLAKIVIREAQAGLRLECSTGWRGLLAEPLDVASITVDRLGMTGKTAEVTGWSFGFNEGTKLKLAEITDAIFDPTEPLDGRDPAPDSDIRRPWEVEQLTGLTVTSGAAAVLDTSILTRTQVSWTAPTGQNIRSGGYVEIQYTPAAEAIPSGDWPNWTERGNGTSTVVPGLLTGRFYLFKARFVQGSPLVEGAWSDPPVRHQIAARRSTKIFRQTTAPTGDVIDGDEWFDTDDGNAYYVRVSGSWVATPTGTGGLEDGAATFTDSDYTASATSVGTPGPGEEFTSVNSTIHTLTWTNSTSATRQVQIEFSGIGYRNSSGGGGAVRFRYEYSVSGGGASLAVNGPAWVDGGTADREYSRAYQVDVAAGATITVLHRRRLTYGNTGSSQNATWEEVSTRLTAILK